MSAKIEIYLFHQPPSNESHTALRARTPRIQTDVLGHSLVRSLVHSHRSLVGQWLIAWLFILCFFIFAIFYHSAQMTNLSGLASDMDSSSSRTISVSGPDWYRLFLRHASSKKCSAANSSSSFNDCIWPVGSTIWGAIWTTGGPERDPGSSKRKKNRSWFLLEHKPLKL